MSDPIQLRLGGYGPPTTTFSRALRMIGGDLEAEFGGAIEIKYVFNILDLGYRSEDILWLVEHGLLSLGYQSTSYMTARVPELGFIDLPFLFDSNEHARAAMDGGLGAYLSDCIERRIDWRILGYFENGYRHISNSVRPVRTPADLRGLKTRVLPSKIQARTFELLGAVPLPIDLTEAIAGIGDGSIDAQENPLANTVAYGVHTYHRYHTLSSHFYISRGIFVHRDTFDALPAPMREALRKAVRKAIDAQRVLAPAEVDIARQAILDEGCEIVDLTPEERALFIDAVQPLHDEAKAMFGPEMFKLLDDARSGL